MGHKVHPMGFRIGVIRTWQSRWYADKHYREFLHEDLKLRQAIQSRYPDAGISLVEIDRQANKVSVVIHTARPGIVIGRGGQRVDEMRLYLENIINRKIQLNIQEIHQPELDAYLVARAVAEQIERRIAYRRAMKQAIFRTMQAGAKGIRISCAGRLGGVEIARSQTMHEGRVPLHTLRADIDYGFTEARTTLGRIGVKLWIYKGDILPEPERIEVEEKLSEPAADEGVEAAPAVKLEEKLSEPAADEGVEAAPAVKLEEKLSEPAVDEGVEAAPAVKLEEMLSEPAADEGVEAVPAVKLEEKLSEPAADEGVEAVPVVKLEEEPTKTVARKRVKAVPAVKLEEKLSEPADKGAETVQSASVELEENDATTQASEIPQDS